LFFKGESEEVDPQTTRPGALNTTHIITDEGGEQWPLPVYAAYSQGFDRRPGHIEKPLCEVFEWSQLEHDNRSRPIAYCTSGTHKFFHQPQLGRRIQEYDHTISTAFLIAGVGVLTLGAGIGAIGAHTGAAGLVPGGIIATATGITITWAATAWTPIVIFLLILLIIAVVLLLIALIAWLVEGANPRELDLPPDPTGVDADFAPGNGPALAADDSDTQVDPDGIGRTGTGPDNPPLASSRTAPVLTIINRFHPDQTAIPAWWDFTGRWGIEVAPEAVPDWSDGMYRRDREGRTPLYWSLPAFIAAAGDRL
jgi:hypothetical protein